ncbi:MAG: hypothetical protein EBS53_17390, partial [Bacteroidetes bacterium]|nr:hypothetical protein [Bacteroidota bacterium]
MKNRLFTKFCAFVHRKSTLVLIVGAMYCGVAVWMLLLPMVAVGQLSITSTTAVTQNFNSIGSSATATLPTGWRGGSTTYSGSATATTQAAGTSGTGILTSLSAGGFYNFANDTTASSTDRAIGFLTSGSYSSPRRIFFAFTNNTGSTITSISLSWDYEKYRSGSRAFAWTFFHGSTDTASTAATDGDQSYSADANNTTISNPPTSISKSFSLTGLSIANGDNYYLRWVYTGGSGGSTNAQGLGIDNFSITLSSGAPATSAPTVTTTAASNVGSTTATTGGNVTSDGGAAVSA